MYKDANLSIRVWWTWLSNDGNQLEYKLKSHLKRTQASILKMKASGKMLKCKQALP